MTENHKEEAIQEAFNKGYEEGIICGKKMVQDQVSGQLREGLILHFNYDGSNLLIPESCSVNRTAYIDEKAIISPQCIIKEDVSIRSGCIIKRGTIIESGCVIEKDIIVGKRCIVNNNIDVRDRCIISKNTIIGNRNNIVI